MKKIIIPIVLILASIILIGEKKPIIQNKSSKEKPKTQHEQQINSLETELTKAKEDTNKVNILNALALKKSTSAPAECIKLGEHALDLSEKLHWQKGKADAFRMLGIGYNQISKYDSALSFIILHLKFLKRLMIKLEFQILLAKLEECT